MSVYLQVHTPARTQYRGERRAEPTGAVVIHTAENDARLKLPDDGAEAVARFIAGRKDAPGSYHSIVDSDTTVRLGRYDWEMFHDGTGGNRWSLGLAFACRADQWPFLPPAWRDGAINQAVGELHRMSDWLESVGAPRIPARRITAHEYRTGVAGLIGHGELDPGRRSDPGKGFPWTTILGRYAEASPLPESRTSMATITVPDPHVTEMQRILTAAGIDVGKIDGVPGPKTQAGVAKLSARYSEIRAVADQVTAGLRFLEEV